MRAKRKIFLGSGNIANCITLAGLLFSVAGCFFALGGKLRLSMSCLIASGICDLFDGAVARKIKRSDWEKAFGIQLDTVVDVVSFGVAPVLIVYSVAGSAWYMLVVYAFYMLCAVTRLAYFNTTVGVNTHIKHYSGLPVTYISLILPAVLLLRSGLASVAALFVAALLFVLNIKIPKPRGVWYVILPLVAAALAALWWLL